MDGAGGVLPFPVARGFFPALLDLRWLSTELLRPGRDIRLELMVVFRPRGVVVLFSGGSMRLE